MLRRQFIGGLVGAVPLAVSASATEIPEYDYEWNPDRKSTDPSMPIPGYAENAPLVSLNGQVMNDSGLKITRCRSGKNGWIEYLKFDANGRLVIEHMDIVRERVSGLVEVRPRT